MDTAGHDEKVTCKTEIFENRVATEDRLCNGHAQPSRGLSQPAHEDRRENDTASSLCTEPSDRLQAQFIATTKAVSCLDGTPRNGAVCLFEKVRPLLSVNNAALGSGTEEQMLRLWSACILYCALKLAPETPEVRTCKLSHVLDGAKVSFWDFFKELPPFLQKTASVLEAEYGNARERLRQVKDLQASFTHLAVLFNYYKRNYNIFFLSSRMTHCSCSQHSTTGASITCDHLRFGWMLFLALREHVLSQFDLVTCTNGLIAILAIMILHVPAHRRKFSSFKADSFSLRTSYGVDVAASLCQLYEASEEDVLRMLEKASDMICKLLNVSYIHKPANTSDQLADIDTEKVMYFDGLMGESSLCSHLEILNKDYEERFKQRGELDERVFLDGGDAVLGMLSDSTNTALVGEISNATVPKRKYEMIMMSPVKAYSMKGNLLSPPGSPRPSPMKVNSHKMPPPTPITSTMTSAKWLRTVIAPLSAEPSPSLLRFLQSCDSDITNQVKNRAQVLLEAIFSSEKKITWGVSGGMNGLAALDSSWAEQRRLEALKLYHRVLGCMCQAEAQRLHSENLSALLVNERFHRCMLACSAELVLATYKTVSLNFPAVLEPTGITAFDVWKVIESFVRHEETLPRELKRHLNSIEEKILEKLAWEKGSSLFNSLIIAKPNLQGEIYRLNLLAEPMPSLEALYSRYQLLDGGLQDDKRGLLYSPMKFLSSTASLLGTPARLEKAGCDFLSPGKDRQSASSTITLMKARVQPPLQSAFASPQRLSHGGGGETCAETVVTIFLQKALKLAAIRIKILCESVKQPNIMEDVYKTVQHILFYETSLLFKRHIDQILLCSMYGVCKVKQLNVTFKQIIQHYKQNPHDSYIYRTVFFDLPSARPLQNGGQGTGDIISFYNTIFVPAIKGFLMQLNLSPAATAQTNEDIGKSDSKVPGSPGPSPFSSLPDMSPKKVSAKHNVYVSPLRSSKIEPLRAPSSRSLYACVGESPSKDLAEINNRVNSRHVGRLDFGDAGLVTDSVVAGNLYPFNNANSAVMNASPDSVHHRELQQLSRTASSLDGPLPKRLCMDR